MRWASIHLVVFLGLGVVFLPLLLFFQAFVVEVGITSWKVEMSVGEKKKTIDFVNQIFPSWFAHHFLCGERWLQRILPEQAVDVVVHDVVMLRPPLLLTPQRVAARGSLHSTEERLLIAHIAIQHSTLNIDWKKEIGWWWNDEMMEWWNIIPILVQYHDL